MLGETKRALCLSGSLRAGKLEFSLPFLVVGVEVAVVLVVTIVTLYVTVIIVVITHLRCIFKICSMQVLLNLITLQCKNPVFFHQRLVVVNSLRGTIIEQSVAVLPKVVLSVERKH